MKRLFRTILLLPILTSCSNLKNSITFISNNNPFETYYDDSYFTDETKDYRQDIALASYASAMASIDVNKDYSKRGEHLSNLWEKEGFTNVFINKDYKEMPTLDSVGYGIASKRIKNFNLIAVTVRGAAYDAEWANNFTLGAEGDAKGFSDSSKVVLQGISDYVTINHIEGKTKFWLSGYSRGASIINLLAASMLNDIEAGRFYLPTAEEDIYAYCFETIAAAAVSEEVANMDLYKGIHNIINFNDIIPLGMPYSWGFVSYGEKHYYPDRITDIYFDKSIRKHLVSNYHFMRGAHNYSDYTVDDWKFYDPGEINSKENNLPRASVNPSLGRFARNSMKEYTDGTIPLTREFYVEDGGEEGLRNIFATIYGYNPNIGKLEITGELLIEMIFSYSFIQSMLTELQQEEFSGFANDVEFLFYEIFGANENNIDAIKELYNGIYYFLLLSLPNIVLRKDLMLQFFSRDNLLSLFSCHATEVNYSFLMSCDQRLYGKKAPKFNDGTYQTLHVRVPTNVTIYEKHLKKTVFSYANGKMSSDTLSAEKLADGSLDIYLPNNGSYVFKTDSSDVSLGKVDQHGYETIIIESLGSEATF